MSRMLWTLPVPPTAIMQGPVFRERLKRDCELRFSIEAEDGSELWMALVLEGVESYRCVYLTSGGVVNQNLSREAYGALVSVSASAWLVQVEAAYLAYPRLANWTPKKLQHLMIGFDDGPWYEFICTGFRVERPESSPG
jgi:hypothetical protein